MPIPESPADAAVPAPLAQPEQVRAVLGFVAAGRLTTFAWFADVAVHASDVDTRAVLSGLAAEQMASYADVSRIAEPQGGPLADAAQEYLELLDGVAARIRPADWWEDLIRSFVAGGMVTDFAGLAADLLTEPYRSAAGTTRGDQEEVVVGALRPAVTADPRLAARLALWGRRVAGETLGVVQPALVAMAGSAPGSGTEQLDALGARALSEISAAHARRMDRLGLAA